MASTPIVKTRKLTRDKLASFLKSQELIKAFENLQADVIALPDAIAGTTEDAGSLTAIDAFRRRESLPALLYLSTVDAERVLMQSTFVQPPHVVQPRNDADAAHILSTQIFGA